MDKPETEKKKEERRHKLPNQEMKERNRNPLVQTLQESKE